MANGVGVGAATTPPPPPEGGVKLPWITRILFLFAVCFAIAYLNSPFFYHFIETNWDHRAAESWRQYARTSSPGIAVALLVAFYFDVVRRAIDNVEDRRRRRLDNAQTQQVIEALSERFDTLEARLSREPLDRIEPTELVEWAALRTLGEPPGGVQNLVSAVLGKKGAPIITRCSHHFTLKDLVGTAHYEVIHSQTMHIELDEYVIALCASAQLNEAIAFDCPMIFDTWFMPDPDLNQHALDLIETCRITTHVASGTFTRNLTAQLEVVPMEEWPTYVGDFPIPASDLRLLRAKLARPHSLLTVEHVMKRDSNLRYIFWQSDRPTFMEVISFDVTNFLANGAAKFSLLAFAGCTSDIIDEPGARRVLELRPNEWLVKGQGAVLLWSNI